MEVCRGFMSEPVIVFERVSKSYPMYYHITGGIKHFLFHFSKGISSLRNSRFEALNDVSFEVYRGETFGIIGRNGAGKSTTLGLVAGVLKPTKGKIVVKGRVFPLLELGAGFHPELTGRENIVLNGVLMGLTRAEVLRKMEEIIEFAELRDFIDQPIRVYSSGMLTRLGFSVIAHLDPEILLLDEVLAVGDIEFQKKCLNRMAEFKRSGVTMVFVSHSMANVEKICDRAMWIENHSIKIIDKTDAVITSYTANIKG
jgi:lipopolysaccharide transport system ATP-binding protein